MRALTQRAGAADNLKRCRTICTFLLLAHEREVNGIEAILYPDSTLGEASDAGTDSHQNSQLWWYGADHSRGGLDTTDLGKKMSR